MHFQLRISLCIFAFFFTASAFAANEIKTNQIHIADAPTWLTRVRVEKITDHMQSFLEWDIRRIEVTFHKDEAEFERFHGLGPTVLAVSRKEDNSVHIGPRVGDGLFDATFGHELVHIISFQKYKGAIPKWLEEGLANYLAKAGKVDYKKLASQPFPTDVHELGHPFSGSEEHIHYSYMASQALAEMLAAKCGDLANLLRLSVKRNMDNYIDTYCEIKDLNGSFKKWVTDKAASS